MGRSRPGHDRTTTRSTARSTSCVSREEDGLAERKMHADELHMDVPLVRRLLASQFPEWASLPIESVSSSGTVNALYRLGGDLVVRLPRTRWGVGAADRELRSLPKLAPLLPIAIPVPLAKGIPAEGYP